MLVSLLVALTVTPAMSMILLSKAPLERRESPIARWLERGYEWLLATDHPPDHGGPTSRSAQL